MEPRDGNGSGDEQRPAKKTTRKRSTTTTTARKRPTKSVTSAQQVAEESGARTAEVEPRVQTAYDVKEIHRSLSEFSDDDLKQIPIVAEGTHLEQGGTYIDLAEERPSEVKVNAGVIARAGHYYVPKNRVPYTIWNRLIGEAKPGQEASGAADRSARELSTGGDGGGYGRAAERAAAESAAELKTWMDTRPEDRNAPKEVL